MIRLCLICCSLAILASCARNDRRTEVERIVAEWMGKEITFPDAIPCTSSDSAVPCIPTASAKYKILMYVDSVGCISCKLNLSAWI